MTTSEHPLALWINDLSRDRALSADDCAALSQLPYRLRRLDPGSYLVREGDKPTHCAVLLSGFAYRQKVTGEGSRQIIAVCVPGEAVDLQNMHLDISDHSVQLLTPATVADIPREALVELARARPMIAEALMIMTLIEASILREWVVNVGRRDSRARLAHILCEFAVRLENRGLTNEHGFELPMTQEQLADATGLTSVHVNRVLRSLELEGLITRRRRQIQFPDWRRLQTVDDFNRRYLHVDDHDVIAEVY